MHLHRLKYILLLLSLLYLNKHGKAQKQSLDLFQREDKITIPFSYIQGFLVIDIQFQYIFPLTFIFDTGAQNTLIFDKKITDFFIKSYSREINILGADYSYEIKALIARNMVLTPAKSKANHVERDIIVLKEDIVKMGELIGRPIHGIIGSNFFKGLIVEIDYRANKITLHHPNKYNPEIFKQHTKLRLLIEDNKPYVLANIQSNNLSADSLKLLIDTGASLSILLQTDADSCLFIPQNTIVGNLGKGLGGDIKGYIGKVQRLSLSPDIAFDSPISYFQNVGYSEEISTKDGLYRDGILGNGILDRFHVIIDYNNQFIHLKKNKNFKEKFIYDRSGLSIIASGPTLNDFVITSIIPNSPAAAAGLQVGDHIIGLNYLPKALLTLKFITDKLASSKRNKIRIKIRRNGKKISYILHLRDLI